MPLKKQNYTDEEIPIFDEAFIYKRGAYWHFMMWLNNERKYASKNLRTRSKTTTIEKGKEVYLGIVTNPKTGKTCLKQVILKNQYTIAQLILKKTNLEFIDV